MAAIDRAAAPSEDGLPFYFVIVLLSTVIPMTFEISGLFMTASRLVLLFVTPVLLIGLFRGTYGPLNATDILFGLFLMWFGLAILIQTPGRFVTFVGSNFIIMAGGYLVGRCGIRNRRAFKQMIVFYGLLVLISLPFAIYEMTTSVMPIARWIEQIPGISSSKDVDYPSRNELERVQFVFVHPIHYGLFSAYIFGMVLIGLRGSLPGLIRLIWATAIGFCTFSSGSSGPFTCILIVLLLLTYDKISGGRWKLLLVTSAVGYVVVDLLSNRPAYFIVIEKLAFNPGTAYGRRTILEAGLDQIWRTPIFGTPYPLPLPPWMTGSLDNYWLGVAVAYGLPAFLFLMGAYLRTIIAMCRPDLSADPELRNLRKGWVIGTVGSMFSLATVFVWSELLTLTFLIFGSGVWLTAVPQTTSDEGSAEPDNASPVDGRLPLRFSRF